MDTIDYDKLFQHYRRKIKNLQIHNKKLLITFSGVTASGKSTVAKFLAKKTNGLYLSADDLRTTVLELWPNTKVDELQETITKFGPTIQNRLINYPNKLHILDTNIDTHSVKYPFW